MKFNKGATAIVTNVLIAISTFISMPLLIRKLGADGFEVFGLLLTAQSLAQLIESGVSVTAIREVVNNPKRPDLSYLHSKYLRFFFLSMIGGVIFVISSRISWGTSLTDGLKSALLIGFILAVRIYTNFYRSQLYGIMKHNTINVGLLIAHLTRFWIPLYFSFSLDEFLSFSLFVFLLELIFYNVYIKKLRGYQPIKHGKKGSYKSSQDFSKNVAFITILGVLLANIDKLFFPYFLNQYIYGSYHGIYFLVTGALMIISPYNALFQPILMKSRNKRNFESDFKLYYSPIIYGFAILILLSSLFGELIQLALIDSLVFDYNIVRQVIFYGLGLQFFGILFMYSIVSTDFKPYKVLGLTILITGILFLTAVKLSVDWNVLYWIWLEPILIVTVFFLGFWFLKGLTFVVEIIRVQLLPFLLLMVFSFTENEFILVITLVVALFLFLNSLKRSVNLIG